MMRHRSHSAFALLLTLFLVLLAGVSLAHLARRSMIRALEVRGDVERLQRRWAVTSIHDTLLPEVERLLNEAELGERGRASPRGEPPEHPPMAEQRINCRLAGRDYQLVLTDEQARLNVNRLLEDRRPVEAGMSLQRLIAEAGGPAAREAAINLRPLAPGRNTPPPLEELAKIGAYDQIFPDASPGQLIGSAGQPGLARFVTCWGDGQVNFQRADPAVIRHVGRDVLSRSDMRRLIEARGEHPHKSLAAVLARLDRISEDEREQLRKRLTDGSTCFGLWVIARGPQRDWYALAIDERGGPADDGEDTDSDDDDESAPGEDAESDVRSEEPDTGYDLPWRDEFVW